MSTTAERTGRVTTANPEGLPSPTQEEFVETYLESSNRNELVQKLKNKGFHMTYNAAAARIKNYMKAGINLPPMQAQRRGKKIDVDKLNTMIKDSSPSE